MDSGKTPLKEVDESTRQDFMEYLYQFQKVGTLDFTRRRHRMARTEEATLSVFCDSGFYFCVLKIFQTLTAPLKF